MRNEGEHGGAPPVKLDAAVEKKVRAYVRWKLRQPSARKDADDIAQEAFLTVLSRGSTLAGAFKDCRRYVGRMVAGSRCPVSIPMGNGCTAEGYVAVTVDVLAYDHRWCTSVTPEDHAVARQVLARWLEIKDALAKAEAEAAGALPAVVRKVGAAVLEARAEDEGGGIRGLHVEIGRKHGITPQRVARAVTRYERAIGRSPTVAALQGEMRELRREARSV